MSKKTYADLQAEIARLQKEAESAKQEEVAGVVARIREAIQVYGLTPRDLGFTTTKKARILVTPPPSKSKAAAGAKYADSKGNSWSGRGPRPHWLREQLAGGHSLEEFRLVP